ncbi:unnamed protein product [Pedinophyceae sp. YPF-701]|nr:unnamed protein product [Pedinophyceae sp. YPF-701]
MQCVRPAVAACGLPRGPLAGRPSRTAAPPARRISVKQHAASPPVDAAQDKLSNGGGPTQTPAAPAAPPAAHPVADCVIGPAVYALCVSLGEAKSTLPLSKMIPLGIAAGIYVGFGAMLAMSVGGNMPGAVASNPGLQKFLFGAYGFPTAILMVCVMGAELFTGNAAFCTMALREGRAKLGGVVKNLSVVWLANFVGAAALAATFWAAGQPAGATPGNLAVAKCSLPLTQAFVRAVLCNFLVCIAVIQGNAARSLASKFVGILLPLSCFASLGLEHSVANMFIITLGMLGGADVTFAQMMTTNIIPVTIGNFVGAAVVLGGIYGAAYGKKAAPAS